MSAAMPDHEKGASETDEDLWVFGYGSLMWRPGFCYLERHPALLRGYHRSFCVYSWHHRGTPDRPGLVFGIDRGGACRGIAYRVAAADAPDVRRYLYEREQVTMVYRDIAVPVRLLGAGDRRVTALTFAVDRSHDQYAGRLSFDEQVARICEGEGQSGDNPDYLFSMVAHLEEMGISDHHLEALAHAVKIAQAAN